MISYKRCQKSSINNMPGTRQLLIKSSNIILKYFIGTRLHMEYVTKFVTHFILAIISKTEL